MTDKLVAAFSGLLDSTIQALPKVVIGILLVIVGLIVAKVIERVLRTSLEKAKFDELVRKVGIDQALGRMGIRESLSAFLARSIYYLVLLILAQTIADALGLTAVAAAIGAFFAYFPNIVAALLLLIVGSSLGAFIGNTVAQSALSSGIEMGPAIGRLISGAVFFVCAMMAVAQLQIDTAIVRIVTSIILGGAALAFGLSFGFGTQEIVRNITAGFYARKVLEIGKPIELLGHKGTLKSITATHVIMDADGQEISIANTAVLTNVTKQ
jgi:small-conductance mechanosensitive channel